MKKSILAITVSAALGASSAQAAVEVYGKLHLSLDQLDNGNVYNGDTNNAASTVSATKGAPESGGAANAGTKAKSLYVSNNRSILGFKASEDLEGGMKAIAVLEFTIEADNQVATVPFSEREVYGGLGGGFGTVRIGKIDTPTKLLGRKADFFSQQVGDARNLTGRASGLGLVTNAPRHNDASLRNPAYTYNTTQRPNWEWRATNALAYTSPTMGGVTVAFLYNPDEGRKDSRIIDLTATLAGDAGPGKMVAGLGWSSHGKAWNNDEKAETNIRFAGSYAIDDIKVGLFYQKSANMNAVPAVAAIAASGVTTPETVCINTATVPTSSKICGSDNSVKKVVAESLDRTTWGIGGSYKIGAGAIKAQYYKAGVSKGAAEDPADAASMIVLGYDHNLSKNTKLYVAYAKTKNDDNGVLGTAGSGNKIPTKGGTYAAAGAAHAANNIPGQSVNTINNGSDPKALSLGMIFTF